MQWTDRATRILRSGAGQIGSLLQCTMQSSLFYSLGRQLADSGEASCNLDTPDSVAVNAEHALRIAATRDNFGLLQPAYLHVIFRRQSARGWV